MTDSIDRARLAETIDRSEIGQLAFCYAAGLDRADGALFASVFWPEAVLRLFKPGEDQPHSVVQGHEQLTQMAAGVHRVFDGTAHIMSNHRIECDGDSAEGEIVCTALHLVGEVEHTAVIRYEDRYERRGGHWRIIERAIRFRWTGSQPALTGAQALEVLLPARGDGE